MKAILFNLCFFIFYIPNFMMGGVHSCQKISNFDDILLVVHYNHPFYGSMDFIKTLYSEFPNIVFYGDKPNENNPNSVIQVPSTMGYLFTRVVADVLTRFPHYRGYLFLQDDVLINFWNFGRLSKDKIWFGIDVYTGQGHAPSTWYNFPREKVRLPSLIPDKTWDWWNTPWGVGPLEKALPLLNENDRAQLIKNLGCFGKTAVVSDMFYLPGKFRERAIRLGKIFGDVFLEISVPMMLACLDFTENWENLRAIWGYGLSSSTFNAPPYRDDADWVHPIKFSKQSSRDFALQVVQAHIRGSIKRKA